MFCPKCGAQNPDGAGFCGSCGAQFAQRQAPAPQPAAVPSYQPAPAAGGVANAAGKLGGLNPKVIGIAGGVVVLVLLIVLVRLFACSGGTPNLVELVTKPSSDVANIMKGQKEMSLVGQTVYTNNEDFVKDLATSSSSTQITSGNLSSSDVARFKKYNGSYILLLNDNSGFVTLEGLNNGSKPTGATLAMIISADKLTAKDAADRVAQMAPYDKVYAATDSSGNVTGMAKGNGCVTSFYAAGQDGLWVLAVNTMAIDTSSGSYMSSSFDSGYDGFDSSNYSDSYKK